MKKDLRPTVRRRNTLVTQFFVLVMLLSSLGVWGQVWNYNFGTGTGTFSTSGGSSTSFLPAAVSGQARVRVGTGVGSFILANPGIALGTATELQMTSNSGSTSTSKMSISDYVAGKVGYLKFKIAFNGGTNGVYNISLGDGNNFSDNNQIAFGQVFSQLTWSFGATNTISYSYLSGGTSITTGLTNPTTLFSQSTSNEYSVEIYMNNTTAPTNYVNAGTSYTLTNAKWDLWVNGVRVGTSLNKGNINPDVNIDSFAFNHQVNASNPGTIYIDDIEYSNTLPTASAITSTATGGLWSAGTSWVGGVAPSSTDNVVIATTGTNSIVVDANTTRDAATTTTVNAGSILATGFTYTNNGTTTINGTFQINTGGFGGGINDFVYGANANLIFNHSGTYGPIDGGHKYWPATGSPTNVTLNTNSTIDLAVNRSVAGTFQTASGVLFPSATLTLNGIAQINPYGYFGNSPIYGNASTLIYNTGTANGAYGRASEWNQATGTIGSTPGYPNNVQLSNTSTLDYPNTGGSPFSTPLGIAGSLTIDAGSALYMDFNGGGIRSGRLTVGKDVNLAGNISLGDAIGGDLYVGGNWTKAATSTFNPNNRAVFFNGTAGQTITGVTTFAYLTINNAAGVTLANNIVNNFALDFTLGRITLGANNLTIANGGSIVNADTGKYIVTSGAGQLRRTVGNTATLFAVGNTDYNPITFTNSGTSDIYGVRVSNTAPAGADPSKTVTRQWITSEAVAGGSNLSVVAQYNSGETGANYNAGINPFIGYYDGAAFTQVAATLSGANPITATSAANLSPVSLTAGTGYFAVGKDNGLISVPAKYVISNITPTSPIAGSGFNATVTVQDAYNQSSLVSSASTFNLTSNGNAGAISGTTTGTISAGTNSVVVTGIILPNAGTNITITATNSSGLPLTAGTSAPFTVLGLATKLMFSGVPANGTAGSNLASFTVRALRADDSLDTNYTGTVTIAKASGSGTISGTLTRTAAAGVATFNDIQFDAADTYTITATATGLTSATSGNIVIAANPATGYFRSNAASGNWNAPASWQSSADGITGWATSTVSPTSAANTITIRNGNTITITAAVTIDQVVIESGGVLTPTVAFTVNDNISGDDIIIQNGGTLRYATSGIVASFSSGTPTVSIEKGGRILVMNGSIINFIQTDNYIYRDASILEYDFASNNFNTGTNLFPNADVNTIPIFRISSTPTNPGSGSPFIVNGVLEVTGSVGFAGGGTKTFRNGIRGNGTVTQTGGGKLLITGSPAELGGGTLTITGTGLDIAAGAVVNLISNKVINTGTINLLGTLDTNTFVISGSSNFKVISGGTLITSNTGGIPASITTTNQDFASAANYVFNANTTTPYPTLFQFRSPTSLTFNNANVTSNLSANMTVSGAVNINGTSTYALNSGGGNLALGGAMTIDPNATFDNGGENQITNGGGSILINGTFITRDTQGFTGTNTAIPGIIPTLGANSTIVFGRNGEQDVTNLTAGYNNITFRGSGLKTVNGAGYNISGMITIENNATLDAKSVSFGGTGTKLTMLGNALFKTGGSTSFKPDASGTYTLDPASTIEFQGTSATEIRVTPTYENVIISGTNVKPGAKNLNINQVTTVTATPTLQGSLTIPTTPDNVSPYVITSKKGVVVQTDGKLILENNAQLMQDADAVNTGDITAQRITTVPNSTFNQYVYFSSPVIDQNYKNIFGGNTSALRYVESTDKFVFSNGFITSGGALAVRNPTKTFGNITAEFKGTPFVGDFDYGPLDFTDLSHGYNLVGNPYPSNLDLNKVYVNSTNLDSTFLFWDNYANTISDQQGSNYHGYAYATFNAFSNTGVKATGSAGNTNGDPTSSAGLKQPNNILKVGQGMLVKTLNDGVFIGFKNADRITAQSGAEFFGKSAVDSTSNRYWLEMLTPANLLASNAIVYFENGTNEFSKDDSKMESSVSDALFTNAGEEKVVINGRSTFADTDVLQVGNRFFVNGTYQIRLGKKEGIFANGQKIYLKDRLAGVIADLEQGSYSFSANAGEQTGRFEIIYKPESVLATTGATTDQLQVYRNGEVFTVKSSDGKIENVEVYDLSGRLLQIALGKGTEVNIDAAGLSNGLYILKIKRNNSTISKKIIK